jgi:non-ribosomal peptide synthetase component F
MGLFINTLPLRVDVQGGARESVLRTHERLASLLDHEHASLALAQRCSSVPQGTPLFSSMLNYRHNDVSLDENTPCHGIEHVESCERTNYPIMLSVEDFGGSLGITSGVMSPLDPTRICGYMQEALQSLVEAIDHRPDADLRCLEVVPAEERHLLLHTWNTTQEDYPAHICLHHLFEQQVERTPDATAVVFMDQSLSYGELNEKANQLAHHLIGLGVKPETRVAICVDRSLAMIVGVLAILKAGGAYVPLDPAFTSDRLRDILMDATPSVAIVDASGRQSLGEEALSCTAVVDLTTVSSEGQDPEG